MLSGLTGTGPVGSQRNLFWFRTGSRPKLLYNLLITNKMKKEKYESQLNLRRVMMKKM